MKIESILKKLSKEVMTFLGFDYYQILIVIAINGTMNGKKLGEWFQNNAKHSFDRWGVKSRMEGLGKQFSLIDNDYTCEIKINKKETQYGLTLKGIIASLQYVKFEDIYHIKNFRKLLKEYVPESQLHQWILDFIKFEIALILFHNYVQGIEWKKFRYLKSYLKELKKPYKIIPQYFLNTDLLKKEEKLEFEFIKSEYLKLYFLIYLSIPETDDTEIKKMVETINKKTGIQATFESRPNNALLIMKQWYVYLEYTDMDEAESDIMDEMIHVGDLEHYDAIKWYEDTKRAYDKARNVLKRNGMSVKRKRITLGERP